MVIEERKFVGKLIRLVLVNELGVRDAINKFPNDVEDESIRAAFHALIHLEADEDLRKNDILYKQKAHRLGGLSKWWARKDSNLQPSACKADALTS